MEVVPSPIPGCFELFPKVFSDARGTFVKTFHDGQFKAQGLEAGFLEEYYSVSHRGVLRGLHFQLPPMDHIKMVYCVEGEVMDVVLDLRKGSPAYGKHAVFNLSGDAANMLYIPAGLAHGFYVKSDRAIMLYKTSTVHSPSHDAGIRWDSAGIPWPSDEPVISSRDASFPSLAEFESPFSYAGHRD